MALVFQLTKKKDNFTTHEYFGAGQGLGVRGPSMSGEKALHILKDKYGPPIEVDSSDGKVTWEYHFITKSIPGVKFRIYDYKGYLSNGFGIPKKMELTQEKVARINHGMISLLREAFSLDYYPQVR